MRTILKSCAVVTVSLVAAGAAAGCSSSVSSASGHPLRVVAAENFWGSIAAQLAGRDADVTSIINNPDTDPHDYEPTAQDARTVASADLVIENGIGYDPWAHQLIAADGKSSRGVLNVGQLLGIADGGNPHQWYSQASVTRFIHQVTSDLETLDPSHRSDYERNERAYETTALARYSSLITEIKRRYAGTPIGGSESIITPWAATLGLKMETPESFLDAIAEGNEPTASDKATADAQIREHQIKVFVFNSQNSTPDVQRLVDEARQEHIPVTEVTETLAPANVSFQDWQVRELEDLLGALAKGVGR
jgi:zinc/manganese transport system substrate-binding protein